MTAVEAQIIDLDAERAKREAAKDESAIRAEAKTLDPDRILAAITERRATFSRSDLNRALKEFLPDPKARGAFTDRVLSDEAVVPLRENENAPVSRYTTRAVLSEERRIVDAAARMESRTTHGVSRDGLAEALGRHPMLDQEQRDALHRATGAQGFTMIAGEAGTGKTTTFAAIRDAHEADNFRILGMSWKNDVVQRMRQEGFSDASTILAELMRQRGGRGTAWDRRTVLMIDEATMISSPHLAEVMERADAAGAKVILGVGPRQLGSIERGGMTDVLQERHGAAELHTVWRTTGLNQQAFNDMYRGDFRAALEKFDQLGSIHWNATPEDSMTVLVAKWAKDSAADPDKTRFALAYTNAEVDQLNLKMREVRKARGELGDDHALPTATGPQKFAAGDRVVFTANAERKAAKDAGFYNGSTGTVAGIKDGRMTVSLDGLGPDGKPRTVSFVVGDDASRGEYDAIRHYLAGTVWKSQGNTLDQTYVLHSDQWRAATSYVAGSRHRESVAIFAAEKASPWVMAEGGLAALDEKQRARAEQSYAAWAEAKPDLAKTYDLANYVGYVQARWAEEERLSPLDRLAQQMGRPEERRAASGFVQGPMPVAENVTTTEPLQQDNRADGRAAVQAETATVSPENPAADYDRMLQERIAAAKEITERGQGPERPASSGQDDEAPARKPHLSLIAKIVGDYLELCYNPAQNWVRWITEELRDRAAARRNLADNEGRGSAGDTDSMDQAGGLRGDPLHELPGRMDKDLGAGGADRLLCSTGNRSQPR